jgi:hypothetical protein
MWEYGVLTQLLWNLFIMSRNEDDVSIQGW